MKIKKNLKSMISLVLVATFMFLSVGSTQVFANENTYISYNNGNSYYAKDAVVDAETQKYIDKVVSVSKYYYFDGDVLKISLTKDELINDYNFTDEEYAKLSSTVLNKKINLNMVNRKPVVKPLAHVSNGALYISNDDLKAGVFAAMATAASAGPAAMAAALTTISTAMGGPVGTVLSIIFSVAAGPSLVELCGRVTWALATNQGIYIKPVFSYPPLEIGYYK